MFRKKGSELEYFSTKVELTINKVKYRPTICYKIPPFAKKSLDKLEAKGTVTFYKEKVRFVNGGQATKTNVVASPVASIVRDAGVDKPTKKRQK